MNADEKPTMLAVAEEAMTTTDLRAQVQRVQHVLRDVMQVGTHYGTVPGCGDKPVLLKAGAEKLMMTFRLAAEPSIEDMSTDTVRRYRVLTRITSQSTGLYLGTGVGEGSSEEEKYAWRAAVCEAEYECADPADRRLKYKRHGEPIQQVRVNPSDVANTVLKMAKKRSLVDGILTVTAASDIFTQDVEEMPDGLVAATKPAVAQRAVGPAMALPNYGDHKGQPMDDPAIPVDALQRYLVGVEKSLADPAKSKWKHLNERMRAALVAEEIGRAHV